MARTPGGGAEGGADTGRPCAGVGEKVELEGGPRSMFSIRHNIRMGHNVWSLGGPAHPTTLRAGSRVPSTWRAAREEHGRQGDPNNAPPRGPPSWLVGALHSWEERSTVGLCCVALPNKGRCESNQSVQRRYPAIFTVARCMNAAELARGGVAGEAASGGTAADVAQGEDDSGLGDDSTLHDLGAFGVFG